MDQKNHHYKIAVIPGDGIGPEVIRAGLTVLETLSKTLGTFTLEYSHFDWSSASYVRDGRYFPADGLAQLKTHDAILFGAVGHPSVPDHISLWGLRLAICQPLQQYANVRPTRILRGLTSPLKTCTTREQLDWVIVRENSEGEYAGQGGRTHAGTPWEVATEVGVFSRVGIERIMRFAFALAASRPRRHLVVVTKSNAQRYGMVLWDEVAAAVSKEYPAVTWERELVDAMTVRMVQRPASIDVVVASNLHADILSDLAAALAGSIGIAPTSNLDPSRANPSMFEPIHGSALDLVGKNAANPVGTFWTAAEMLRWLAEEKAADELMAAVEAVCEEGVTTKDLGGQATTEQVTDAACRAIRSRAAASEGKKEMAQEG